MNSGKNGISIVVPYLNETEGILSFCKSIDSYALGVGFVIELVFVDDGSVDDTSDKVCNYEFKNVKKVKLIKFSRNFGSHAAIRAGLLYASYDICTWMGSDLQEPVEFLEMSYNKILEGYDAVYLEKKSVKISIMSRAFSKIYSSLMCRYAVKNYPSGGFSNIVFNNKIKRFLNENIESNSSIMLQITDAGYKSITISLDYKERFAGVSKWTLSKKIKLFIDSFVAFSFAPLRLVSLVGIGMFVIGFFIGCVTLINKIVNPTVPIGYSTLTSIMALGFGVTNISLGVIAEYLWRTYDAARRRPPFIVSEVIDIISEQNEGCSKNENEVK